MIIPKPRPVIVLDFGAQYSQLIARRVRESNIFSLLLPHTVTFGKIKSLNPQAVILSGGPADASSADSPKIPRGLLESGIPIFGICYGFQEFARSFGAEVGTSLYGEYGLVELSLTKAGERSKLFENVPTLQKVWMSHKVVVKEVPEGFENLAHTSETKIAALGNSEKKIYGVQWHPEVVHTRFGKKVLRNFLYNIAEIKPDWTPRSVIHNKTSEIQRKVGKNKVICGLSGGVDSAVAAALVERAVGPNLTCIFIDHGLLREGEREQVEFDFLRSTGLQLKVVDKSEVFLNALKGVTDPEEKRKIIGEQFIRSFESVVSEIGSDAKFLVQGTLYPDIIESGGGSGTANIKSHHNVGGLPDDMEFKLVEPFRDLFKDEVRRIGVWLGMSKFVINRQPFPGPGLAVRIIGEITKENLRIIRKADAIVRDVLEPYNNKVWQCPVILLPGVRTVGVKGDGRHYGYPIVIRPVTSEDAMTADWCKLPNDILTTISNRITNEVSEITRVVLDITQKPPGTIEWE